jgi:hypothetical protein
LPLIYFFLKAGGKKISPLGLYQEGFAQHTNNLLHLSISPPVLQRMQQHIIHIMYEGRWVIAVNFMLIFFNFGEPGNPDRMAQRYMRFSD